MNVYGFIDYKEFIKHKINENKELRGYQTRLSEAAGCRLSYLSQVLTMHVHLTPEHAAGLTIFWSFLPKEAEYFVLLVNMGRSDNLVLRQILERRRKELLESIASVASRIQPYDKVSLADQQKYYSSWLYSAVHILVSVPAYRTVQSIARRLYVLPEKISMTIDELINMGLIESKKEQLKITSRRMHVGPESTLCSVNHSNWRYKTVNRMQTHPQSDDLNYTAIYSLSKKDSAKLREMIFEFRRVNFCCASDNSSTTNVKDAL